MIRQIKRASMKALSAVIVAAASLPIWAHHSHNSYEVTVWSSLEGTVKEVHLMNPHSWIYLDVVDANGETTTWALEAAGPGSIMENGVKPEDVRPGDRIEVRLHLLRDGTNGGLLGFVTPMHGDQARGHGVELEWD
jgi:hypothetical protein